MPTHYHGDPKTEQALNTWIKLSRAFESVTSRLHQRSSMGDLTVSQFGVLEILRHLGSMPQCDLAAKLLKSSGNITMVIDNLEKRGLVRREADEKDRRVSRVVLTPAGSQVIDSVFPQHADAVRGELSVLSHEEQETLGRLLRKLGKKES